MRLTAALNCMLVDWSSLLVGLFWDTSQEQKRHAFAPCSLLGWPFWNWLQILICCHPVQITMSVNCNAKFSAQITYHRPANLDKFYLEYSPINKDTAWSAMAKGKMCTMMKWKKCLCLDGPQVLLPKEFRFIFEREAMALSSFLGFLQLWNDVCSQKIKVEREENTLVFCMII